MTATLDWFPLVNSFVADGSDPDEWYTITRSTVSDDGWIVSRHVGRLSFPWQHEPPPTLPPNVKATSTEVTTLDEAKAIAEQWENRPER
jgi:hypothetical protein